MLAPRSDAFENRRTRKGSRGSNPFSSARKYAENAERAESIGGSLQDIAGQVWTLAVPIGANGRAGEAAHVARASARACGGLPTASREVRSGRAVRCLAALGKRATARPAHRATRAHRVRNGIGSIPSVTGFLGLECIEHLPGTLVGAGAKDEVQRRLDRDGCVSCYSRRSPAAQGHPPHNEVLRLRSSKLLPGTRSRPQS